MKKSKFVRTSTKWIETYNMNARHEILTVLGNDLTLEAAEIHKETIWDEEDTPKPGDVLLKGHTINELDKFLEELNFDYDSGYGGQELYGTLWFTDGTWAERGEYDGSEWWERRSRPEIPIELVTV